MDVRKNETDLIKMVLRAPGLATVRRQGPECNTADIELVCPADRIAEAIGVWRSPPSDQSGIPESSFETLTAIDRHRAKSADVAKDHTFIAVNSAVIPRLLKKFS
jgi:hypothetical protein